MTRRNGISLVELLVCFVIALILLALVVAAVTKVRQSAGITASNNKLRQLGFAYQMYADTNSATLREEQLGDHRGGGIIFTAMLPFLEAEASNPTSVFLSPIDPSQHRPLRSGVVPVPLNAPAGIPPQMPDTTSFAVNSQLCLFCVKSDDATDGSSQTILFSERYSNCNGFGVYWSLQGQKCKDGTTMQIIPCDRTDRRATFADPIFADDLPRHDANGIAYGHPSRGSFQVAPSFSECRQSVVQSLTSNGLNVAMFDGSVRTIRANVSPSVYWAYVTPGGGESPIE